MHEEPWQHVANTGHTVDVVYRRPEGQPMLIQEVITCRDCEYSDDETTDLTEIDRPER